jgi:general secretion pathway protein G
MPYCAWCGSQVAQVSYAPCPSCGQPSNGSPKVVPKSGTNTALIVVGVVAGVFALIFVGGIVAAIAIPNLLTATQRAKQKRTLADMRSIATAVEAYATDQSFYPDPDTFEQAIVPKYIRVLPKVDGWGNSIRYECWSSTDGPTCDGYAIGSAARDGKFENESLADYEQGATTNFDSDIVFSNGQFIRCPQGLLSE